MRRVAVRTIVRGLALTASAALLVALPLAWGHSQEEQNAKVALRSVYLDQPIDDAHQITIEGELGGTGRLTLDGNRCSVSLFGDTDLCTQVGYPGYFIKLERLDLPDPSGAGRRIFQLIGGPERAAVKYYLVVPSQGNNYRLVADFGDHKRRVLTLEPVR